MKIIVTHISPDLDGIMSVWLIKKFLPGWEKAEVRFVPAGERLNSKSEIINSKSPVETMNEDEIIHLDTGFGPLDHHETEDQSLSAASLTWDYVKKVQVLETNKQQAIERMVSVVTDIDHFKEVFWDNPTADYHEFSLLGILEGLKQEKPGQDGYFVNFISLCLEALLHNLENRVWAEKEIAEKGKKFTTKWGEGIGIETVNDSVLKLAQKMGYAIVLRKDPRKGYIRINARPAKQIQNKKNTIQSDIDLTLVYEKMKKMDPQATWFLHISKKILLNGSVKNPKMRPTTLSLDEIIKVLENL